MTERRTRRRDRRTRREQKGRETRRERERTQRREQARELESNPGSVRRRAEQQAQQGQATGTPQQEQPTQPFQQAPVEQAPQQEPVTQVPPTQYQQPTPQQGSWQQPTTQPQVGQLPAGQQFGGVIPQQQPIGQQGSQQQAAQQPQQVGQQATGTGGYTAQPPLAIGVPAQASAETGSFTQAAGLTGQPVSQAGAFQGGSAQLASQSSEIYPEEFVDHLSEEARNCLDDCIDVSQVAAWCADRTLEEGAGMAQCSRLCNEASTLGSVTAEFIARDSMNLPSIVEAYVETAERATDELSKFDSPHTNEAEMVLERSIDSSLDMLETR